MKNKIIDSFNNYEEKKKIYKNKIINSDKYEIKEENNIPFIYYYKNNKIILKSKIQFLGDYKDNIFTWGWNNLNFNKNIKILSKKIFDFGYNNDYLFFKQTLCNNKFIVKSNHDLKLFLKLILKEINPWGQFFFKEKKNNIINYYILYKE